MHTPIPGGFLVAIEGVDGSGKTTQAAGLAEVCEGLNLGCVLSKEPTDGQYGGILRRSAATGRLDLREELELFTLDRREHVASVVQPALDAGKVVVLDRYYYSTAAYQGARGADPQAILLENASFAPPPDLLALLDAPCELGLTRVRARGDQPNLFERLDLLEAARRIFLGLKHPRLLLIDATAPMERVRARLQDAFKAAVAAKMGRAGVPLGSQAQTMQTLGA